MARIASAAALRLNFMPNFMLNFMARAVLEFSSSPDVPETEICYETLKSVSSTCAPAPVSLPE